MTSDLIKSSTSACDADIMVKLARAGELGLLGRLQRVILIPEKVRREALRKIGTKGSGGASIGDGMKQGWLRVVDVYNSPEFTMEQHASIQVFINSYRDFLGPGELEAAALAHEFGVPLMFSDDREAQRYIEAFTDVKVLRLHEVITLGKMQDYPLGTPIPDLMRQAEDRLNGILPGID
jgi:predicted nucleic acid-binding protein